VVRCVISLITSWIQFRRRSYAIGMSCEHCEFCFRREEGVQRMEERKEVEIESGKGFSRLGSDLTIRVSPNPSRILRNSSLCRSTPPHISSRSACVHPVRDSQFVSSPLCEIDRSVSSNSSTTIKDHRLLFCRLVETVNSSEVACG